MGPRAVQLHLRWRPPGRPDRLRHRAPGASIRDVAYAIYRFAPLTAPDGTVGVVSPAEQARRARLFCDQCGEVDRARVIKAQCRRLLELVDYMRAETAKGDTAFQWHLDGGHDPAYLRRRLPARERGGIHQGAAAAQAKTTVRWPLSSTRCSACHRTAWASTRRSTSCPLARREATVSSWVARVTSCSMIGPSSRSAVT